MLYIDTVDCAGSDAVIVSGAVIDDADVGDAVVGEAVVADAVIEDVEMYVIILQSWKQQYSVNYSV